MQLRPYQSDIIDRARRALDEHGSAVLQMPTGGGKTRVAAEIISTMNETVWFMCHRQEIERQAAAAFRAAGIDFGVVSPRGKPEHDKRVQIVSVAAKCLAKMPQPELAIWDECHHVPAKSWAALHSSLNNAKHLGLTATPERLDGKGLKDWFSELVAGPSISDLVEQGYLSPFRYFAPSDPDLTAAKLQAGDYHKKDADAAMNTPVLIGDAVAEYRRSANGKRAVAFCTSIEASKALVARFNAEGIPAAHVDGQTRDDDRRAALAGLASGEIKIISNVDVFTEGVDVPGIEAVILMRPTKSVTLLLQMIGRALRFVEGKTAIIMDHAGLHRDHGWFASDWQWSIDGGAARARRMGGGGPRRCPQCKEVRGERLAVCACGYEFPTGREIGEFDGVLHEVRGEVPEGCVTVAEFRRKTRVHPQTIPKHISNGMPNVDGYPKIPEAIKWLDDNEVYYAGKESGLGEDLGDFARRFGVKRSCAAGWAKKGMPYTKASRTVPLPQALKWVSENINTHKAPPTDVENASEYVSQKDFAGLLGVNVSIVERRVKDGSLPSAKNGWVHAELGRAYFEKTENSSRLPPFDVDRPCEYAHPKQWCSENGFGIAIYHRLRKDGLPCARNGWVHRSQSIAWARSNPRFFLRTPPIWEEKPSEFESVAAFAKRTGYGETSIAQWRHKGLPASSNGWIHVSGAMDWIEKNTKSANLPPREAPHPWLYESKKAFSSRIGRSSVWASRHDLPCASNGWVHIQKGLEWVRDNTNIKIPPEAWPTANDNAASAQADAA